MSETNALPAREAPPKRRRLRFEEFVAAAEAGAFGREPRLELIEGELVEMSPQSTQHFQIKARLARFLTLRAGEQWMVFPEPTIKISAATGLEPDIAVFPFEAAVGALDPAAAILFIEVAVSSLDYDMKTKAPLYAKAGVREYWVVDVEARVTHVHRAPAGGLWAPLAISFDEDIFPIAAPALGVCMGQL